MDKLSPQGPLPKPELSTIQMYYLAFSARKKLHGLTSRDNMRLRHLVGHANLLDGITAHEEREESHDGRQKLEAQIQHEEHILPPTTVVTPEQMASDTNLAGVAEAGEIDARFEEGLGIKPGGDACLSQKDTDIVAAIPPAIADIGTDQECLDELDDLMLTRTLSRPLCPTPDSQIKGSNDDPNTCPGIDHVLSEKAAVCEAAQSIPLLTTATF